MAPFKLKFRMGSSRSTSQETDTESQPAQPLLNNVTTLSIDASNTTIDSVNNSMTSLSDQRNLLPNNSIDKHIGYINPTLNKNTSTTNDTVSLSSTPSYTNILEENRFSGLDKNITPVRSSSTSSKFISNDSSQMSISKNNSKENFHLNNNDESIIDNSAVCCSAMTCSSQDDLLDNVNGSFDPLFAQNNADEIVQCDDQQHNQVNQNVDSYSMKATNSDNDPENDWSLNQEHERDTDEDEVQTSDTIINNKSSKKIYKAVAKQWGITCEMSEHCRCMECQSNYFDCEYDENEHHKTDGGLGAGTPMFISEAMHNTVCTIL